MTIPNEELSLFDRSTLIFWRVSNLIGWSLVALLAGFMLNFLLFNLNVLVFLSLGAPLAGAVTGSIVGRRLYRFVLPIATAIGGLEAAMSGDLLETWDGERLVRIALGSAAALVAARVAWGRRPIALRGGRRPR